MSSQNPFARKVEYEQRQEDKEPVREANSFYFVQKAAESADDPLPADKKTLEKPVGLNLVTDFSLKAPTPQIKLDTGFVDLNDLKVLSKERAEERSARKVKRILKKGTSRESPQLADESFGSVRRRSPLFDWKTGGSPKRRGKDELSPSDRPIMIGFSMPRDERRKRYSKELDVADSQRTPLTPSIVVTPAKEDDFWAGFSQVCNPPRATSSIYSQPTPRLEKSELDIPPVPAIPSEHVGSKSEFMDQETLKRQSLASRKCRSYSTGTGFEEDVRLRAGLRSRSYSSESVKRAFDRLSGFDRMSRLSVNTEMNRHLSQGWWTYLLSPLLDRTNTITSRKTLIDAPRPPVPSISTQLTGSSDEWWEKEVSYFSPDTPENTVANRGIADWHPSQNNPFADDKAVDFQVEYQDGQNRSSFVFPGRAVQGAAAEYYQACAHELFSGRPYFECINHVCSLTPRDKIPTINTDTTRDSDSGAKGLLIDVDDAPKGVNEGSRHSKSTDIPAATCSWTPQTVVDKRPDTPAESPKEDNSSQKDRIEPPKGESSKPGPKEAIMEEEEPGHSTGNQPEKQSRKPFVQPAQPTSTVPPPVNNIYLQSAPGLSSAPVSITERVVPQYVVIPTSQGAQKHEIQPQAQPQSPGPISPGLQRMTEKTGSIPLSDMHSSPAPAYVSRRNTPATLPPRMDPLPITREATTHPATERDRIESQRRRLEKEDAIGKKAGGLWRGRGCFSNKGCFGRPGREGRLRRRWYAAIASFFIIIVVVALVLSIMLTRKGDETPVQSQWLNLTGYPPMPTGIATIAGPEPQVQNSGCITPSTLWSCALPNEQQSANKPYAANQPNFRVEIRFRNGTYSYNATVASKFSKAKATKRSDNLFRPSPSPPDMKDQTFLGNTTDKNQVPYAGEETPFYMTILSPLQMSTPKLTRRSDDPFPNIESLIPSPDLDSDGTAAAATLYPLPESQPVLLYDRGRDSEHYGFYTYFDRPIFLESTAPLNGAKKDDSASDANGGPSKAHARVRCTWAQTRFLVQIWTRPGKTLLSNSSSAATPTPTHTGISNPISSSSATDFVRPGSFPYPVTITIDRHGGVAEKKMVYCYGMESDQHINSTEKKLQIEDRGFGGKLVSPAPGIFNISDSALRYHRLWAHRSYSASTPLKWLLAAFGAGSLQGSIRFWVREHRLHHRYTDTDLDPYTVKKGFFHAHILWVLLRQPPNERKTRARVSLADIDHDPVVVWQHKYYFLAGFGMGWLLPCLVAGVGWNDWAGGFLYAGVLRAFFVNQATFCVNSLAHYLGHQPYDDRHTPRDHLLTALITLGEGFHNFHHEFPSDYRNGIEWHQVDVTKWFIWVCGLVGLAGDLKRFRYNEIAKARVQQRFKRLDEEKRRLEWGTPLEELPVMDWTEYRERVGKGEVLVVIEGVVHDVQGFIEEHPWGESAIRGMLGKDATPPFNGGVYDHSRPARNLLATMRVAVLRGGGEVECWK
ncbi:uncharacterized protein BDW43DRAFT_317439 [Aspergillus alliaceus]|uniref:uncharacterized protein n=1 Tax=Petromyces alliaceus TaxID=209559 RepID=UPI0012A5B498|nr:uncharacterized protein BDW43DRAFT_317439 [Aspergillus alliaceus]KAB8226811.1 hypothetical protein BDW43DRAFT_317439 [Aspergillus alliaceus]